jgi:hypothetical protein
MLYIDTPTTSFDSYGKMGLSTFFFAAEIVLPFSGNLIPYSINSTLPLRTLPYPFSVPYHYCPTMREQHPKDCFAIRVAIKNG